MKISIIGLGWYGEPLAKALLKQGHNVLGTTRSPDKKELLEKAGIQVFNLDYPGPLHENLLKSDLLILNIPPFGEQPEWFKSWNLKKDTWIIFISSTSVLSNPESKSAGILKEEENWIQNNFIDWTILRFAGLIGNGRHPGKHLAGKQNLPGRLWPVNLVHLDDCLGVTMAIIEKRIKNKVFEVAAVDHPRREEYYSEYSRKNNLPLPEFDQSDDTHKEEVEALEVRNFYKFQRSLSH